MATATSFTLNPSMLFQNGRSPALVSPGGGPSYWDVGQSARYKYTTSARWFRMTGYMTNLAGQQAQDSAIGVMVNDVPYFFPPPFTANAYFDTGKCRLPRGLKTFELIIPAQGATGISNPPQGGFPITVSFDQPATEIAPSLQAQHLVIYGDSITSGTGSICDVLYGWAPMMQWPVAKGGYNGSVTLVAWGYRALQTDVFTPAAATAFVAGVLVHAPTKVLLAIGSNDLVSLQPLSTITTMVNRILDEFHAQAPNLPIQWLSPIRRGTEGPNAVGVSMSDIRSAISTAISARSGWSVPPTYTDGLAIFPDLSLLNSGQTHPTTAGHKIMHDYLLPLI